MITRSKDEDNTIWQDAFTMALRRAKMDTRIQHENEPSQGPSAIFWHAKDFATAHEVAAGAWETPPAVKRWLKMLSRMARWFYDQSRIWTFPLSCVHLVSISGQCDASIMKIHFVGKSLWFMQNNNGVKQRFLDCFLKILDKKRKKWRELLPDQYISLFVNQ